MIVQHTSTTLQGSVLLALVAVLGTVGCADGAGSASASAPGSSMGKAGVGGARPSGGAGGAGDNRGGQGVASHGDSGATNGAGAGATPADGGASGDEGTVAGRGGTGAAGLAGASSGGGKGGGGPQSGGVGAQGGVAGLGAAGLGVGGLGAAGATPTGGRAGAGGAGASGGAAGSGGSPMSLFITRNGSKLYEGTSEFRWVSVDIPNYFIVEDPTGNGGTPWHRVTDFEQRDAAETVRRIGGRVFRTYVFSVQGGNNVVGNLAHVYKENGTIKYNEDMFKDFDRGIAIAKEKGIRLMIPWVDNWGWFSGPDMWGALAGGGSLWTDAKTKAAFKEFITWVVNRTNTVTGTKIKDEPAIFAWELGNELSYAGEGWIGEMAAYLKSQDPKHLVVDGSYDTIRNISKTSPDIDIITTHYQNDKMGQNTQTATAAGKAYLYGEYDPSNAGTVAQVVNTTLSSGMAGSFAWSLRFHTEAGGFYFHDEFGNSLQYPGFDDNERATFKAIREGAFKIQGLPVPAEPAPAAPRLLPITNPNAINWQGSAGAATYRVERASSATGPWTPAGANLIDCKEGNKANVMPLYTDNPPNGTWWYRVIAVNGTGESVPSNVQSVTK